MTNNVTGSFEPIRVKVFSRFLGFLRKFSLHSMGLNALSYIINPLEWSENLLKILKKATKNFYSDSTEFQ